MTAIAREAGVAVSTVSRLLQEDPALRISDKRRRAILQIKDRLGGVKMQRRRRRLTHTIIAPVNRIFSSQWIQGTLLDVDPLRSFEQRLKEQGFRLCFEFVEHEQIGPTIASLAGTGRGCDGLLILSGVCSEAVATTLRENHFAHVSYDFLAERFHINTVHANLSEGTARVVEHFQSLEHRRIGYLGGRNSFRYPLFAAAMAAAGLPMEDTLNCWIDPIVPFKIPEDFRVYAHQAMRQWLDRGPVATALVCFNDYVALGASDAMRERGLTPGREISLTGYDNIEQRGPAPVEHPVLTTLDNPTDRIGRRMADLLLNQILHDQSQIVHERLPARLIVRETSGPNLENN
jgi:LacI family transcriptional regulator